jgi:hypothetical protein
MAGSRGPHAADLVDPTEGPDTADDTRDRPHRPSIEDRAARRASIESSGRDRYEGLLWHLRAGREISLEPSGRVRLDWHPIAGRLLLVAAIGVAVYLAATWGASVWRDVRVDTWDGPAGVVVQSGQQLPSCPVMAGLPDPVYPTWVRYDGRIFERTGAAFPMNVTNIGTAYVATGHRLGGMELYEVRIEGVGPLGSRLLVKGDGAPGGDLYRLVPSCS